MKTVFFNRCLKCEVSHMWLLFVVGYICLLKRRGTRVFLFDFAGACNRFSHSDPEKTFRFAPRKESLPE